MTQRHAKRLNQNVWITSAT